MRTNSSTQSVQLPVSWSRTRCVKRLMPSLVTVAVPDAALTTTEVPQLTLYSKASTLVPTSGMSTEPSGEPTCQFEFDTTVWSWEAGANGPMSVPHALEAEAWAGAMTSAVRRVRRNMRIRGLTTPVIGRSLRSCSVYVSIERRKARTTAGSKSVPAPRSISATAASTVQDSL